MVDRLWQEGREWDGGLPAAVAPQSAEACPLLQCQRSSGGLDPLNASRVVCAAVLLAGLQTRSQPLPLPCLVPVAEWRAA